MRKELEKRKGLTTYKKERKNMHVKTLKKIN